MNRRGVWAVMLLMALWVVMPKAWGQRPPQTEPPRALVAQDTLMSWDRSAMPGDIELMAPKTMLAYDRLDYGKLYGRLFVTCAPTSHPSLGRCPTEDTGETGSVTSKVGLVLTESRTKTVTEIAVHGQLLRADGTFACSTDTWKAYPRPLHTSYAIYCTVNPPAGTSMHLWLPSSELERLVAGKWTGAIELNLRSPVDDSLGVYRFSFDFTITDRNAVSIYFPAFHHVTPLVQLNSDYDPIRQTVGGRTSLEMCLYDGLGSQAQYLGVTVRDRSGKPPGPGGYSLWHTDGGSDDTRRLDYTVTLDHNGAPVPMPNGVEQQLHGIDTAQLRLVLLPGMSQPVFCVPTPITFDIPRVPISTQQAGTYFGELQVELRVPTVTP